MKSVQIACIIDTLGKGGGAEQLLTTLVPRLVDFGVDVEIIAVHDCPFNHIGTLRDAGIVVHELHALRGRAVSALPAMARLARKKRYDVYWGHLRTGSMFARWGAILSGGRAMATLHSEGYARNPPKRFKSRLAVAAEGLLLAGSVHVAVGRAVADDYARYFGWHGIAVAHNGVEVVALRALARRHSRADIRAAFGYSDDDFLIVTPARFVSEKGQIHLIRAVAKLRDEVDIRPKLLLCGSNSVGSSLHADLVAMGLNDCITISDLVEQNALIPLIANADAVVMPSLYETFGIAAAEALALEIPAVLTQVDGFQELVGDSNGALLVPPADPNALAAAIMQIYNDPAAAAAMAKRGGSRVEERFSIDICAWRWKTILDAVHKGRAIPALD